MRILSTLLAALLGLCCCVEASQIPWKTDRYNFRVQDTRLSQVLQDYGMLQGVRVSVSERVDGEISGNFDNVAPDIFLDQISKANGLVWFWDGSTLYFYHADEVQSEVVTMSGSLARQVQRLLEQIGASYEPANFRVLEDQDLVILNGPPRFVQMAKDFAVQLSAKQEDRIVQVFPLKYAWAYDLHFPFQGDEVTVPGVATLLQNVTATGGLQQLLAGGGAIRPSTVQKLKGQGLIQQSRAAQAARAQPAAPAQAETTTPVRETTVAAPASVAAVTANAPQIYSDVRLNAVVVRDTRQNIYEFEQIIAALDVPVAIIEITASIVDVAVENARTLGMDFQAAVKTGDGIVGFGFDSGRDAASGDVGGGVQGNSNTLFGTGGPVANAATLLPGLGGNASALIVQSGYAFLARVRALEERGNAKILSQPSVLTLDNVEATLRNDETFYVRVAGREEVDLFNISAGVALQVTPHVIEEAGQRKIKLVINIRDGNFTQQSVDNIPVVRESTINTQATILENQSLLIGGYTQERMTKNRRAVPLLGSVPVLGYLFKRETTEKRQMERMFLLTPRIVSLNYGDKTEVSSLFATPTDDLSAFKKAVPVKVESSAPVSNRTRSSGSQRR